MSGAVGFDLDMTLVDTRPGIRTALVEFAKVTGRPIDAETIVANLGPPVTEALAPWFDPDELPGAVSAFRAIMAEVGVMDVSPLPGAAEAIAAARAHGLRVIVVTAKIAPLAVDTLRHAGLAADLVVGDLWADQKAVPLRQEGAVAYAGDHPRDMSAALEAGVPGYGVTTGASTRDDLVAAGADEVADSLEAFGDWLGQLVTRQS